MSILGDKKVSSSGKQLKKIFERRHEKKITKDTGTWGVAHIFMQLINPVLILSLIKSLIKICQPVFV